MPDVDRNARWALTTRFLELLEDQVDERTRVTYGDPGDTTDIAVLWLDSIRGSSDDIPVTGRGNVQRDDVFEATLGLWLAEALDERETWARAIELVGYVEDITAGNPGLKDDPDDDDEAPADNLLVLELRYSGLELRVGNLRGGGYAAFGEVPLLFSTRLG